MDGYVDDDDVSVFDNDEMEADYQKNPDFQRFIRSVSRSVTTQSIGLSFDFENLAYETRSGKKILQDVTGTMARGSMWGVMGGSGAGKSTFLNVLMGKASHTGGAVKINGWYVNGGYNSASRSNSDSVLVSQRQGEQYGR